MYINFVKLNEMIKNRKKVLIVSPGRRTGKTEFIIRNSFHENNFYFTLTREMGCSLEKRMFNRNHKSQHQSIKNNINRDYQDYIYFQKTDTIFLDDVELMPKSFIERILVLDTNIIAICNHIQDYNYNLFAKNGFTFLYAPCDNLMFN